MKTEYAILRDGSKIPVSDLYLDTESSGRHYPLRCSSNSDRLFWTMSGHYEIDQGRHSYDILNIDDVLETLNHSAEDPLAQYRTPQAMADTHAAYARGEMIESVCNSINAIKNFIAADKPCFNWAGFTYRPAPKWEPKVGEIVLAKLPKSAKYRLCFYSQFNEVWLDLERSEIFYATDIKPFTQDK